MITNTPAPEFDIDACLVQRLLAEQHGDLALQPLTLIGEGWDNAMYRLGDHLVVRLPRRAFAAALISHEQRWLPTLSKRVSLPVPSPYRVGKPGQGYPWNWSVLPWLDGITADLSEPSSAQAGIFGQFLRSLHFAAPSDAPVKLRTRSAAIPTR